jgi:hypothetical protein
MSANEMSATERRCAVLEANAFDRPAIMRIMREIVRSPSDEGSLRPAQDAEATC